MAALTNAKLRAAANEVCRMLRRSQTSAEAVLWQVLRGRKFHGLKFYRQYPLFIDWLEAETFFVADFFCFERRVVIEVDGRIHDYRTDHDQLRSFLITQMGIGVVRVRNEDVMSNLPVVLNTIEQALFPATPSDP